MIISKILSRSIVSYYHRDIAETRDLPEEENEKEQEKLKKPTQKRPDDNKTNGKFSGKSRSRLKNTISKLIEAHTIGRFGLKYKSYRKQIQLNFVTLTLPSAQAHDDRTIKAKCLNPFIQELIQGYGMKSYVWRAEKQKNNNIHFHIIVDSRIPHADIRTVWNRCIERLKYVSTYRERMERLSITEYISLRKPKTPIEEQKAIQSYKKGVSENWSSPNSTDIHRIEKITELSAYVGKYMTKTEQGKDLGILGHCWGKSENLEICEIGKCIMDRTDVAILEEKAKQGKVKIIKKEYVTYYSIMQGNIYDFMLECRTTAFEQAQINWCILEGLKYSEREIHHY